MEKINYEQYDLWLKNEIHFHRKKDRNNIIALTKFCINEGLSLKFFEDELEKYGYDEITIKSISDYVMIWNIRNEENAKVNKKSEDYKYIKNFSKISVFKICKELGIDYANLMKGKSSAEKTKQVKEELERQLNTL